MMDAGRHRGNAIGVSAIERGPRPHIQHRNHTGGRKWKPHPLLQNCDSQNIHPGPHRPKTHAGYQNLPLPTALHQAGGTLFHGFLDIFKPELCQLLGAQAKHGIHHHITTTGLPTHAKFWRLPPKKLQDAKWAFAEMEQIGICRKVPVYPDDVPKTAIITPFGTYTFSYSTFSLRNARATFQPLIDTILRDLPFCACYVDDILIFSRSPEEHLRHVRAVLKRLRENGLVVGFDKCTFRAEKVDFLGHEISPAGVCPMASKVDAVKKFPMPKTIKSLQEFLGMVNYYHHFIPDISCIMYPLTAVLKGKLKTLVWAAPQQQAFEQTKAALAKATILTHLDPTASLRLTTDASNIACRGGAGAGVRWLPTPAGLLQLQFNTTGDPLQGAPWKNPVADTLSRVEINSVHLGIDYEDLAKEQAADPKTAAYRTALTALRWEDVLIGGSSSTFLFDTSMGRPHPVIPTSGKKADI
ncbi:uncharacterized protein [Macrobrachium rosenbergii]|uniref:uncharacterized protein n=1 Tax=Macrobrachium rosenbergii TaxID=79674 RepID=UPI0034D74311